ncbi:phage major capsid protein [Cyclobacterium plantarum]|uniref:Phage major capsid protein n=1 Tax=Cyclobacterium plantarum TaxID=2716263 RepID=A0ABX0HCQ7_9BACT|nr:phage major capsid protein [Cyclobacterium plantarum]NHE57961.1 phage major capsid protein [Cyclobacterium plantarum]
MKKSIQLRKELAELDKEIKALLDSAKKENRDFSNEEKENFDTKFNEAEELRTKIADAEKIEAFEARMATTQGVNVPNINTNKGERYSLLGHINAVRSGKVDGVFAEAQKEGEKELRNAGVSLNSNAVYIPTNYQRDFSVTGDSGTKGGNLVGTDKTSIIESLFEGSLLDKVGATKMLNLVSNVDMPKGGAVVSSWRTENQTVVSSDHTIGQVELRPNRLATRMPVSNQLFIQSSASVEAYFRGEIEKSIQKALDSKYVENLLASADVQGVVNGTNGAALTYAKVQEFIELVGKSEADTDVAKFLINWDVYSALKVLEKASGSDKFVLADGKVDGFDYVVSNRVPNNLTKGTGTDLSAMVFGDFTSAVVAGWGTIEIITDPYTAAADGQTIMNVNSYWDLKDMYFEGKSVSKDIIA